MKHRTIRRDAYRDAARIALKDAESCPHESCTSPACRGANVTTALWLVALAAKEMRRGQHRSPSLRPAPVRTWTRPGRHRPDKPRVLTLASALRSVVAR